MPPKTSKATAQPSVSCKLIDETKIPYYRDDIDTYFRNSIYPNVENFIKIKNNITLVSWDLIYEFFLKIYQNINIIEKNAMFEYYSKMKTEFKKQHEKYILELELLTKKREELMKERNEILSKMLFEKKISESQYQKNLDLYSTKLDKEYSPKYTIKLFDYYRSVEQDLGILNLYNINEDSATDIIIFIHNIIIDTSMGKNNWKNVKLQELSEIIDIEYSEFKDTKLIDVETLLLNNNLKLNVFANLKKYFYYCMYLFQTKLQNSVISPYYQIKYFELFKKIKQKITLNIIKIFDNRIFKVYNDKLNYDIFDRQNFMTKIKERFESFIYFNKVRDIDTLKSIIEELNDGILTRDDEIINERIQKIFAQFSYIFKDIFKLDDKTIDIYTSLIKLYNVLIYVLETNSQFSSNKLYNRFLKIINDFDGLEIDVSFQELKKNVETHFNKPGTSLEHSKESSKKSSNKSVYKISQQIAQSNNETIKSHREKMMKFFRNFQYCDFINANNFTKSQIIGIAMYTDKISYLEGLERLPFENDDIYDEQWYMDMEKELFIGKTPQELYSSLDLGNNLIVTIPKYIKLSDELYRKFGVETKLEEGGIHFYDENDLHISLYDFLLFHFKSYIVSFTAYMIKFMLELIDYYNGLIKNPNNRIKIETRLLSKITTENKVDLLFYKIFNNDLLLISKNLIYGIKHNEMKMLEKTDPQYQVVFNTMIDSRAYNDVIYLLLNEEYIQKKLTKYYDGNYNFSKLINEFNKLKYDYFDVIFLALNDRYTNIYDLGVINFTNYVRCYLQYLIKNQENISKTFDTKKVNKTKKKVIRIKVEDTDLEKERKNLIQISNSLNQTFNNQNSKQIDVNNIEIVKDRTYNIIYYLMLKNKYFAFDINLIDTELLTNIILCLQLNLHNEFILNIVFPQLFKLFYNLSMEENSKMNKKFKIMIDTYNFALFDRIFLLNIPLIEYQKIFVEELLTKVRDIKKSYYISDFLYKKTDISLDDTFINIILYIYYSKYIFTPYTKTNYWKKNSLILLNNYNTFYDYYFKHFEKTPKSNFQLELVNLPKREFELRLLIKIEKPKETPKKPKGVVETITPVVPIEELNNRSMVAGPSSAIQSNIQPINVGRVVIDERRIIDTTTDELYMNLLDELYDLNKNSKEILKSWKLIDKKIYNYKENPHRYKIDNMKLLDRDKRIFKSMLIYKNRFLSRRVYEKFDILYTFLQINDVHYTSIKYSISEKDITKTCGAFTHLTLKICDDNTPKSFYKYLLSNYENEFSERPDLMRKVEYIYLHYGLSDVRSEHYGLEPGLWINIEFENPEIKFRSKNILTKNLNKEYKNIIEFIHNLYMYFIEFVKFNNYTYYIKPNCTTKEIRFITNKELLV